MNFVLRNNQTNKYSSTTYYGIIVIVLIHIIGYLSLRKWLVFSGIGNEAKEIDNNYGYIGLVILNGGAILLFLFILVIYNLKTKDRIVSMIKNVIILVFIIRGFGGYLFILSDNVGTASKAWEFVFSSFALLIGGFGLLGVKQEGLEQ